MNRFILASLALAGLALGALSPTAQATPESLSQSADVSVCGSVTLSGTNETGFAFGIVWTTEDGQDGTFGVPGSETVTFAEDVNGGSVWVSYGISVGAESDWYLTAETATVDTDCTDATPEPETGSILIIKDANGAGGIDFDFDGDLGNFNLENDETYFVDGLSAGSYLVNEIGADGWALVSIDCDGADVSDTDIEDGDVRVNLDAGDEAVCVFTNEAVPAAPEPTATTAPQPTPIVLVVPGPERVVEVEKIVTVISPPNTGDAGLK